MTNGEKNINVKDARIFLNKYYNQPASKDML